MALSLVEPQRASHSLNAGVIRRQTLVATLDAATKLRLTLLVAPAGSGKSVLLEHWQEEASRDARCIVRLDLEDQDANAECFARKLLEALRDSGLTSEASQTQLRRIGDQDPFLADTLGRLLPKLRQRIWLVLDQAHLLAGGSTLALIEQLLRAPTPDLHWILAGQRADMLDTSALLLSGQLAVLEADDLRFDRSAIQQLARKVLGASISKSDAEAVLAASEGWAVGVVFALVSADQSGPFASALHDRMNGARVEVAGYFETAVWRHLDAPLQDFLVGTSAVEVMTADLCNAILGISNAQVILESLHRSQVFMVPLDNFDNQFRYHGLFRQFLQRRLRADPGRAALLDERASRWHESRQHHALALQHAFAGTDSSRQHELFARCAGALRNDGDLDVLLGYWDRLRSTDASTVEAVAAPAIFGLIFQQRFDEARQALAAFDPDRRGAATMQPNRRLLLQRMLSLLANSDLESGDVLLNANQRVGLDAFESGWALILNAYLQMRHWQFDVAWRMSMRARETLQRVSMLGHGYADITALLAERAQCDFRFGRERCEALYLSVCNGPQNAAWVNASTAMAHLRYEQNRLVEAESLLTTVLPMLGTGATIEHVMTVYDTLSRIHVIHERHIEATRLMNHLQSRLEDGAHRRFLAQVCAERIRQCLIRDDLRRARDVAQEFNLQALARAGEWSAARPYDETWERFGHAYAQLLVYAGDFEEAARILVTLRQSAMAVRYTYRVMLLEAALAGCHWEAGRIEDAHAAFNRGLAGCQTFGYPRTAFDDTPNLGLIFDSVLEQEKAKQAKPQSDDGCIESMLKRGLRAGQMTRDRQPLATIEPLTDSELRTLRMLGQGLSNKDIGAQTKTAVSTVKWHVKNLFSKLDVGTRADAIARARELGFID